MKKEMKITLKEYNPETRNITWVLENNTMTYGEFMHHVNLAMKRIHPMANLDYFTNTIIGL